VTGAGTSRLGVADAGELLTLQLAAWVSEAREADTIHIPPLWDGLADVRAQLADPATTVWGHRSADGRLVATVRTSPRPVDDPAAGTAFLARLGVVPDLARQGLGTMMLQLAEARLPATVRRIELVTGIKSLGNHAFYARHGYLHYGRDEAAGIVLLAKDR
jgi:GNAT superfamily N-acetyltransferase